MPHHILQLTRTHRKPFDPKQDFRGEYDDAEGRLKAWEGVEGEGRAFIEMSHNMDTETIKQKLVLLRQQYKSAVGTERQILKVRGLLLKWALERKEPTPKLL